jgi:hypothetical protein
VPAQHFGIHAEQCLAELERDAGSAELLRRDDGAVRQLVAGAVVVGDDHVQAELARAANLVDRRDPAVDGQHQPAPFLRQPLERVAADAVAFVEAARQVPFDLGAELPQDEHGQDRGADAVDVVVAVDADPLPGRDGRADALDRPAHVADQQRIAQRLLAAEERPRGLEVAVSAPDEHAGRDLADAERLGEGVGLPVRARTDCPGALLHCTLKLRRASDGIRRRLLSTRAHRRILGRPCWIRWPRPGGGDTSPTLSAS